MAKLTTLNPTAAPSVMLFGLPFTGKSLLAGKLAEHFKIIYIDMEAGHDVLFQLPKEWQENIEVISLPDSTMYPIAIETVLKLIKGSVDICETHGKVGCSLCKKKELDECSKVEKDQHDLIHSKYFVTLDVNNLPEDTIVIYDSGTQLTSSAIANITKKMPEDYKMEWDDWGSLSKLMEVFYSHIQTAKYKRIVISHVTEAEQEDGKKLLFPVAGSRNFSANVAKFFDHVVYVQRRNKQHMAASATTYMNNIMTGSRSGVALEDMEEANLLAIFKPEAITVAPARTETAQPVKQAGTNISLKDKLAALKKNS